MSEHTWGHRASLDWQCCLICGMVRRAGAKMNPEHTRDINGAFPAHKELTWLVKGCGMRESGYSYLQLNHINLEAEFTALKQAADGMREALADFKDHYEAAILSERGCPESYPMFMRSQTALSHYEQLTREKE